MSEGSLYNVGDLVKLSANYFILPHTHVADSMSGSVGIVICVVDNPYVGVRQYEVVSLKDGELWVFAQEQIILVSSTKGEKNDKI